MLNTNISYLRKKRKLTQKQLGEALGVSDRLISKWERGTVNPDSFELISLSKFFEVKIDDLVKLDLSNESVQNQVNQEEKKVRIVVPNKPTRKKKPLNIWVKVFIALFVLSLISNTIKLAFSQPQQESDVVKFVDDSPTEVIENDFVSRMVSVKDSKYQFIKPQISIEIQTGIKDPEFEISDENYMKYNEIMDYLWAYPSTSEDVLLNELSEKMNEPASELKAFIYNNMQKVADRNAGKSLKYDLLTNSLLDKIAEDFLKQNVKEVSKLTLMPESYNLNTGPRGMVNGKFKYDKNEYGIVLKFDYFDNFAIARVHNFRISDGDDNFISLYTEQSNNGPSEEAIIEVIAEALVSEAELEEAFKKGIEELKEASGDIVLDVLVYPVDQLDVILVKVTLSDAWYGSPEHEKERFAEVVETYIKQLFKNTIHAGETKPIGVDFYDAYGKKLASRKVFGDGYKIYR